MKRAKTTEVFHREPRCVTSREKDFETTYLHAFATDFATPALNLFISGQPSATVAFAFLASSASSLS
jgi:hypothetical protein